MSGRSSPWPWCWRGTSSWLSIWLVGVSSCPVCSAWSSPCTCCSAWSSPWLHCGSAGLLLSCSVPNFFGVNKGVLVLFVWTDTHLRTALIIVRGCIVLSGVLGLLLGLGCFNCSAWPPFMSGCASRWPRSWQCTSTWLSVWLGVVSSCPVCSAWSSLCSGFSAWSTPGLLWGSAWPLSFCCVPNFLDVNKWVLFMFGWTDTHLRTALIIVRGCIVLSGCVLRLLLGLGCFNCSAWPPFMSGCASRWPRSWQGTSTWLSVWLGGVSSCPFCSAWSSHCFGWLAWS
jgi:hypothetical protein